MEFKKIIDNCLEKIRTQTELTVLTIAAYKYLNLFVRYTLDNIIKNFKKYKIQNKSKKAHILIRQGTKYTYSNYKTKKCFHVTQSNKK